ncbi:MAG: ABC transporter substrate-binding protein [Dehalococcoidia bacterium]|nr:ABC transporter substrate-binding protein [Dehalococcoidia bacterium]
MKRRHVGLAILILLATLLVAVPALAGCGGGKSEEEENTILIGIMADFTGVAGTAMQPTIKATEDYLTKMVPASDNPLPGVKVKFTRFNTELKYSKVTGGYEELKARGVDMMVIMNAQDTKMLLERLDEDGMPVIGTMGLQAALGSEWAMTTWSPIQSQGEVQMLWIMGDWDYEDTGRSPKVGHLGYDLVSSEYYQEGIEKTVDANPGKFAGDAGKEIDFQVGPLGNVTWTSEAIKLKSCDYIIVSVAGAMLSSFVAQARAAGYTGKFLTGMEGFPGFWPLVTDQIGSMDQLYGCYYVAWWPWWGEDVPVIHDCEAYVDETYSGEEAKELRIASSVISGWELGMAIEMAIRNAVEAVGAENIDRQALRDGLFGINAQPEGYINSWQLSEGCNNALQWKQRVFVYSLTEEKFVPLEMVYDPVLTKPTC